MNERIRELSYQCWYNDSDTGKEEFDRVKFAERAACAKVCDDAIQEYEPYTGRKLALSYTCTGCTRTIEEISGWAKMPRADREAVMRRCLENVWGTKCKDCMGLLDRDAKDQAQSDFDSLPEAPF